MDTVDAIVAVPTNFQDRPLQISVCWRLRLIPRGRVPTCANYLIGLQKARTWSHKSFGNLLLNGYNDSTILRIEVSVMKYTLRITLRL